MIADARDIAVQALRDRTGNTSAALRRLLGEADLSPADRGLARELTLGVVRRRGTLEAVLKAFLRKPGQKLPPPLREILQIALYQLLFLDRVPAFAAVNEAVRQASAMRHKKQAGFVNGVLRSVQRALLPAKEGSAPLARDVIPVAAGVCRKIGAEVFADPQADPVGYLMDAYSLPGVLAERWLAQTDENLSRVVKWAVQANCSAPLIARVNHLRTDVPETIAALGEDGAKATPHANGCSIVLVEHRDITTLKAFQDGWIQPQDPSATAVVAACDVRPGMKVLDFCAAPGTKTTHLAERMKNTGEIVALDISQSKLQRIEENCQRMGVDIVTPMLSEKAGGLAPADFDVVLADVPCSNTGVLARRPEAKWRFSASALSQLVHGQKGILAIAAEFVRPGGQLVYSTCSMEPEECHEVVRYAGDRLRLAIDSEKLTRPSGAGDPPQWHDGGFCAIFRRA
ncbi:MAG: transcription antitermination factor NusB [Planctomycetota bacterium]|jgi:16S rRNA (cytosine967-C5)-methyltransferase